MAKRTLTLDHDYNFLLLGIICQEKDYRLCHEINQRLDIDLIKEPDYELAINKQKDKSSYSFYATGEGGEDQLSYFLISNKGSKAFLLPEQKQVDYFLLMKGPLPKTEYPALIQRLKECR